MIFIAYYQQSNILQPREQALHLSPTPIASQGAAIQGSRFDTVGPVGLDDVDPAGGQDDINRITIVGFIP